MINNWFIKFRADDLIEQLKEDNHQLNDELDQADIDLEDLKTKLTASKQEFSKLKTETSRVVIENHDMLTKIQTRYGTNSLTN